jgi:hypothetical protein
MTVRVNEHTLLVVRSDNGPPLEAPSFDRVSVLQAVVVQLDPVLDRVSAVQATALLPDLSFDRISSQVLHVVMTPPPPDALEVTGHEVATLVDSPYYHDIVGQEVAVLATEENEGFVQANEVAALVQEQPDGLVTGQELVAFVGAPYNDEQLVGHEVVILVKNRRYRILSEPAVVQPGATVNFKIICRDGSLGRIDGILTIRSNARNHPVYRVDLRSVIVRRS